MGRVAAISALASAVVTPLVMSMTPLAAAHGGIPTRTAACPHIDVLGTRGSGDALTKDQGLGGPGLAFYKGLSGLLPGTIAQANPYPAVPVSGGWRAVTNGLGAGIKVGLLGSYTASVHEGVS